MTGPFLDLLRTLREDRCGATAITTGLLLVVGLGFVGLGVDSGVAYTARRQAQGAADSAAFSGAAALMAGEASPTNQARAVADRYGLVDGASGVSVKVNSPALTGPKAGTKGSVEVVVSRPMKRFLSGFITATQPGTIVARAVATAGSGGDTCVIALDPSAGGAINLNGTAHVEAVACSVRANSTSARALTMNGTTSLFAKSTELVGGMFKNGGNLVQGAVNVGVTAAGDPYGDVPMPSMAGLACDETNLVQSSARIFDPGADKLYRFCGGLTIQTLTEVTFRPGIYFIDGGAAAKNLVFNGNVVVRGQGVTFVLTNSVATAPIPTVVINGSNVDMNLTAPVDGPTAGILFFQDRRAASSGANQLNGGSKQIFKGALYFPRQTVVLNGGTNVSSGGCTQVIAGKLTFNGNTRLAMDCTGMPLRGPGGSATALVE